MANRGCLHGKTGGLGMPVDKDMVHCRMEGCPNDVQKCPKHRRGRHADADCNFQPPAMPFIENLSEEGQTAYQRLYDFLGGAGQEGFDKLLVEVWEDGKDEARGEWDYDY